MNVFAVQYFEDGSDVPNKPAHQVQNCLRQAFGRLPVTYLLLGWNLPERTVDACAEVCSQYGVDIYHWHSLHTGDGVFDPREEWRTVGLDGATIAGHRGLSKFTFVCPNHPDARAALFAHLRRALDDPRYQGVFLDRIRFPSPAHDPEHALACFCEHCHSAAASIGLDLAAARKHLTAMFDSHEGLRLFVDTLLGAEHDTDETLRSFLRFRENTISASINAASALAQDMGKVVGLDCFSPALVKMVGQDYAAIDGGAAWIKPMSYGHALGPSGLPFEFGALADWLVDKHGVDEAQAMAWLAEASDLPLPDTRAALRSSGVSPVALAIEARRGKQAGIRTLLAGIELVEVPGVSELNAAQIKADLQAFKDGGADGLALSWNLWTIPLERLDLVAQVWG